MQLVKAALFGLVVFALGAMWVNRSWVVDAYRSGGDDAPSIRLSGVDLDLAMTEIEPSPYLLPVGPDTRSEAGPPLPVVAAPPATASPPLLLSAGEALLEGIVTGPDGPVAGAVVRIERHTVDGVAAVDVTTDRDGRWVIGSLAGGRYRVRAWVSGFLTMGNSEVRYVADGEVASFQFSLSAVDPTPRFEFVHGGPLYEGLPSPVAVVVGWRSVDENGIVVTNPVAGAPLMIETTAQVEVTSPLPAVTDGDGAAWVELRCVPAAPTPGPGTPPASPADPAVSPGGGGTVTVANTGPVAGPGGSLTARSGQVSASFALPGCRPRPAPAPVPEAPAVDDEVTDG